MNQITQKKIILASKSPRRKELLEQIGLRLEVCPADIDENPAQNLSPHELATFLSDEKANLISRQNPDVWVIGADTIVVVDDTVLGKPVSGQDARKMLEQLSGREHSVITGFTISKTQTRTRITRAVETRVKFKVLSDREIQWYTATQEPYDKAGAYGIQGRACFMVESIRGSYSNVVGLPVCEVMKSLMKLKAVQFKEE